MNLVRKYTKAVIFFVLAVIYLSVSFVVELVVRDRKRQLSFFSRNTSFFTKLCLLVLGIKLRVINKERVSCVDENFFVVSNHLSYTDIFIISSTIQSVFVANAELMEEFPLGTITKYSGGIFVERRSRSRMLEEIEMVSNVLDLGFNVVLFPEGTTSNGETVMDFKTSFFAPYLKSDKAILPICIKYKNLDHKPVDDSTRDRVYYYGSASFFDHFFGLLEAKSVDVELRILDRIEPDASSDRKNIAARVHKAILESYTND